MRYFRKGAPEKLRVNIGRSLNQRLILSNTFCVQKNLMRTKVCAEK